MATADEAGLIGWLEDFSGCVRRGDYEGGRRLFDGDVLGFGTRTATMRGLDDLVAQQWRHIWGVTRGFAFDPATVAGGISEDGGLGWVAGVWSSEGRGEGGTWFTRRGRASFVLKRAEGGWRCLHSHHSLEPGPEPLA